MKSKLTRLFLIAAIFASTVGCTRVPAGNVGVLFDLYGGDKGVTGQLVGPGKYWLSINEELYLFPTFSQNYVWTAGRDEGSPTDESITFQDKEGTVINADVGVTYKVDPEKVDLIFQKYRKGVDEITDIYLRNMVRDAINRETSRMDVADIYGMKKEDLMLAVEKRVRSEVEGIGIIVEKIYWVGAMRLPDSITDSINLKIQATQKAQQRENDLQTSTAQAQIAREDARGVADAMLIKAKAEAQANNLVSQSLTKTLVDYKALDRWDGKLPQVTGSAVPMLNLSRKD